MKILNFLTRFDHLHIQQNKLRDNISFRAEYLHTILY